MLEDHAIELCEPAPFMFYDNGQLAVTDGSSGWMVIVTYQAMVATGSQPETSVRTLVRYAELYRDIAAAAIRAGDDIDGRVWITEATVRANPTLLDHDRRGDRRLSVRRARRSVGTEVARAQHGS